MANQKTPSNKFQAYLLERYDELEHFVASTGLHVPLPVFIISMFLIGVLVAYVVFAVLNLSSILSLVAFISVMSLVLGIPLTLRNARIDAIESNLPDALKHMASVLTSGGTLVSALEETATSDYGPLSADLREALKELREGRTFDEVLLDASRNSGSLLFERVTYIVVDARRAGAALADVLVAIAEDTREVLRIKRERLSRTTMHTAFLILSSIFLAPFIFGFTLSVVDFIGTGMSQALGLIGQAVAPDPNRLSLDEMNGLLTVFIAVEVVLTSLALGVIREGKTLKYLLYIPFMILLALIIFEGGKWLAHLLVNA